MDVKVPSGFSSILPKSLGTTDTDGPSPIPLADPEGHSVCLLQTWKVGGEQTDDGV